MFLFYKLQAPPDNSTIQLLSLFILTCLFFFLIILFLSVISLLLLSVLLLSILLDGGECWFNHSKLSELVKEDNKISEKDCSTYDKTSKHPLGGDNAIAVYERSNPHISGCSAGNKAFAIWQHSNRPKKDNNDIKFSDWIVNTKGKKDAFFFHFFSFFFFLSSNSKNQFLLTKHILSFLLYLL